MAFVKYQKAESAEAVKATTVAKTGKKLACKCGGNCNCKKS
jgi:hypothetical protein